jgi:hypothetical protein
MSENAMTKPCPICGSEAIEIDQGTFDETAFHCKTHGRCPKPFLSGVVTALLHSSPSADKKNCKEEEKEDVY